MSDEPISDMGRGDLEHEVARLRERCSHLQEQVQTMQARVHAKDREIVEYERALERAKTQIGHMSVKGAEVKLGDLSQRLDKLEQTIESMRPATHGALTSQSEGEPEDPGDETDEGT